MRILTLQPSNGFPAIGDEGPVGAVPVDVGPLDEIGCVVGTTDETVLSMEGEIAVEPPRTNGVVVHDVESVVLVEAKEETPEDSEDKSNEPGIGTSPETSNGNNEVTSGEPHQPLTDGEKPIDHPL